jgi:tetratricopeptide (TPR) repeat protein
MLKIQGSAWMMMSLLLWSGSVRAEVITLKSGKVINSEILERTENSIKVKVNGNEIYYENKYIKNIEADEETGNSFKKGVKRAAEGKFDEARQEFEKQVNDIQGSLAILEAAGKGSISKKYAVYLFQGSLHLMNKEYHQGIMSFEQAWEIDPKDPDVNYNLGSAYYSLGEYEKSTAYLSAVLKYLPDDTDAHELIAKAAYNRGKFPEAKERILSARKLFEKGGDREGVVRMDGFLAMMRSQTNN